MTSNSPIIEEAERFLREAATELTQPRVHECLCCYVARLLDTFPCDGSHRHALRYRDAMAPRATALIKRLGDVGACCCDCELFANGYRLRAAPYDSRGWDDDEGEDEVEPAIGILPACEGVRRGSLRPCGNWIRIRRW